MERSNKFISPNFWFSFDIPEGWYESEDSEGVFLFNNPEQWCGNFRISAYKGKGNYGEQAVKEEFKSNPSSVRQHYGNLDFAYSSEIFEENEEKYVSHFWVAGRGSVLIECTFACSEGESLDTVRSILASLRIFDEGVKHEAELIPVRCSEIYQINYAYETVSTLIKEKYSVDFQGVEEDIPNMQKLLDESEKGKKVKELAVQLGITLCCIFVNQVNEYEWCTLMDGNREAPVLYNASTKNIIDPMKLVWSRIKASEECVLKEVCSALFND